MTAIEQRTLAVGIQLPEVERVVRWPELRRMARLAEDVGLDSIWLGDHLLYRNPGEEAKGPWEAWTTLGALAAATERIALGPLVAATSFHNPAMLAKKASTLDEISEGRLILGLGAGWNETEYGAFGFPFDHRVSRFEEAFTIIRRLLAGELVDYDGRYYRIEGCELHPRGGRSGGPPIMVGSMGARMLAITAPHMQLWNAWYTWFENRPEKLVPILRQLDDAAYTAGRDPKEIERTATILVQLEAGTGRVHGDEQRSGTRPLRGSPEAVAEELLRYAAIGIGHIQLVLDPITLESIEWCGRVLEAIEPG